MELYKIVIRPLSSYASLLQSDTFFGAFCWSYKYLYGEEKLIEFLEECKTDGPRLIFSNAFPTGYLPLPMGSYDTNRDSSDETDKVLARKAYQENKSLKKRNLVSQPAFKNIQQGIWSGYTKDLYEGQIQQVEVIHNMVGRDTGIVYKSVDEKGNLFVEDEFYPDEETTFDVYILSDLKVSLIVEVLKLMLELGIGANKSTGKGHFKMVPFENGELLQEEKALGEVEHANGYVALSDFIPAPQDPLNGSYKTLVKYGKLDREYAASEYPFKKPLLLLQAGAVFQTERINQYYGEIISDISAVNGVVVNACTIALPIYIPKEVFK